VRTDYTVIRGDTQTLALDLVLADATLPDLAGATVTFIVDNLFTRTVTDVDESSGEATLTLTSEDTEGSSDVRVAYRYNVQVVNGDAVTTPQRGLFIVLPDLPE
jgi:hypothetical protein